MRIALFHNLPSGGAKRHTFEQVRRLVERGHEITEFVPSTANIDFCSLKRFIKDRRVFEYQIIEQIKHRVPLITPYLHVAQGWITLDRTRQINKEIASAIDLEEYDLAFVKDCRIVMNPYVLRYLETPAVFQCHHGLRHRISVPENGGNRKTNWIVHFKRLYYRPARWAYQNRLHSDETRNIRNAKKVITNSKFSKELISHYYEVESQIVYPGIDAQKFRPLTIPKKNYVLSVGALIYGKGYRFVVEAIANIDKRIRPSLFIAANSKDVEEEKRIQSMARQLDVDLHVERILDDERLTEVYNQARVFVYAPYQEALGMAPLEAMACGTPVVAVNEGGVLETVLDGQTGLLAPRDAYEFAKVLEHVLVEHSIRSQFGSAGVDYVRDHWSWDDAADNLEYELASYFERVQV
jgi:glycosyltransferase involved in cell wall biosynthesis